VVLPSMGLAWEAGVQGTASTYEVVQTRKAV
jgi:hypothetical protein